MARVLSHERDEWRQQTERQTERQREREGGSTRGIMNTATTTQSRNMWRRQECRSRCNRSNHSHYRRSRKGRRWRLRRCTTAQRRAGAVNNDEYQQLQGHDDEPSFSRRGQMISSLLLSLPTISACEASANVDTDTPMSTYCRNVRSRFETSIAANTRNYCFSYPSTWKEEIVSLNDGKLYGVDTRIANNKFGQIAVAVLPYSTLSHSLY